MTTPNVNVNRDLPEALLALEFFDGPRENFKYFSEYGVITRLSHETLRNKLCEGFDGAMALDARKVLLPFEGGIAMGILSTGRMSSSCNVNIWARDAVSVKAFLATVRGKLDVHKIDGAIVNFYVAFNSKSDGFRTYVVQELVDEVLHDEAYPDLEGGVGGIIQAFLDSAESVLILQGPPGTGKTRFLRKLCGSLRPTESVHEDHYFDGDGEARNPRVLYTGDEGLFQNDELFSSFISGDYRALLIEDADHLLKPRTDGNKVMRQFLTLSDGIIRDPGKKLIFSTNLPNVRDIDEALLRPGRCFDTISTRALTMEEVERLVMKLESDTGKRDGVMAVLSEGKKREHVLAEVYRAVGQINGKVRKEKKK